MIQAWRIVKSRHEETAFTGEGARRFGGRWNSPGHAAVYTSESRALATLEVLTGLSSSMPLPTYVMAAVEFEEGWMEELTPSQLPNDWKVYPPGPTTQRIGDEWLVAARSAVLSVPSAVVAQERNYLLNPAHEDFKRITIGTFEPFEFDPRLVS